MDELNNILVYLQENKTQLKENYQLAKIGVFGSFARNEQNTQSDIDIIVEFEKTPGMIKFIQLEEYLSNVLNNKVDLVTVHSINSTIKEQILKEAIFV